MQVWTVGTSRGQLWGFGQGFLYEAPKPEVRRRGPLECRLVAVLCGSQSTPLGGRGGVCSDPAMLGDPW